ncbi:hypothetical protein ERJ75_000289000 [Trypanosoma vivax]|nr:hypothetical protein ERJ75_000289000 [Trypanosoma vivax]
MKNTSWLDRMAQRAEDSKQAEANMATSYEAERSLRGRRLGRNSEGEAMRGSGVTRRRAVGRRHAGRALRAKGERTGEDRSDAPRRQRSAHRKAGHGKLTA